MKIRVLQLAKINGNAYKIDHFGNYGVSPTFNVADLSPFFGDELLESRMTPFQEGEEDVDIPPIHMTQQMNQEQDTSSNLNQRLLTSSRAKKLQQQVTSLLAEFDKNITKNIILHKSSTFVIIRFKHQGYDDPQEVERAYYLENIQRNHAIKLGPQRSYHHRASSE
jgi:hypothetical protein